MEIIQRIKFLIEEKYGERGETSFSKAIGIPQVTLNNYVKGRRGLSYELLNAILSAFPEVSAEWLLRGEGEMLKSFSVADTSSILDVEKENIALKAENKLLRELQGLGERKDSKTA